MKNKPILYNFKKDKFKINKIKLLILIFIIIFCISCKKQEFVTIQDLAYDAGKTKDCTIYIKENDQYIPYLVLTNNYNGHTLLLREKALKETLQFSNKKDDDNDYYGNSFPDYYLNTIFYDRFSDLMKTMIKNTKISISKDYPNIYEIEQIRRKIFLLSCTEVNINLDVVAKEGETLKYFKNKENILCKKDKNNISWWLRSNYLPERSMAWLISYKGVIGGEGVQYENGIRPAFCIPNSTKIHKKNILNSKKFVLE